MITTTVLRTMGRVCSRDAYRGPLCDVQRVDGGLVACNGSRVAVYRPPDGDAIPDGRPIPGALARGIAGGPWTIEGDTLRSSTDRIGLPPADDAQYPSLEAVFRGAPNGDPIRLSVTWLIDLLTLARSTGAEHVEMRIDGPRDPIRLDAIGEAGTLRALIMPIALRRLGTSIITYPNPLHRP